MLGPITKVPFFVAPDPPHVESQFFIERDLVGITCSDQPLHVHPRVVKDQLVSFPLEDEFREFFRVCLCQIPHRLFVILDLVELEDEGFHETDPIHDIVVAMNVLELQIHRRILGLLHPPLVDGGDQQPFASQDRGFVLVESRQVDGVIG